MDSGEKPKLASEHRHTLCTSLDYVTFKGVLKKVLQSDDDAQ